MQMKQSEWTNTRLGQVIHWGPVEARFRYGHDYPLALVSNVNIIPTVGENYVVIAKSDGRCELPGGTLEPGETVLSALRREVQEEVGGELQAYLAFGYFACYSHAPQAYRAHIPHPHFIRLLGVGEVRLQGKPTNPPDGEQIEEVCVLPIDLAIAKLEACDRHDIAAMYGVAHQFRMQAFAERKSSNAEARNGL